MKLIQNLVKQLNSQQGKSNSQGESRENGSDQGSKNTGNPFSKDGARGSNAPSSSYKAPAETPPSAIRENPGRGNPINNPPSLFIQPVEKPPFLDGKPDLFIPPNPGPDIPKEGNPLLDISKGLSENQRQRLQNTLFGNLASFDFPRIESVTDNDSDNILSAGDTLAISRFSERTGTRTISHHTLTQDEIDRYLGDTSDQEVPKDGFNIFVPPNPSPDDSAEIPKDDSDIFVPPNPSPDDGSEIPKDDSDIFVPPNPSPDDGAEIPKDDSNIFVPPNPSPDDGSEIPKDDSNIFVPPNPSPDDGSEIPKDDSNIFVPPNPSPDDGSEVPKGDRLTPGVIGSEVPKGDRLTPGVIGSEVPKGWTE